MKTCFSDESVGSWILKELQPGDSTNEIVCHDAHVSAVLPCCWLLQNRSNNELTARQHAALDINNNIPDCDTKKVQVFRLWRQHRTRDAHSSNDNNDKNTKPFRRRKPIGTTLLLEDEYVKIWEFRLEPHESCYFHRHLRPYVFLSLTKSLTLELDLQGQPVLQ